MAGHYTCRIKVNGSCYLFDDDNVDKLAGNILDGIVNNEVYMMMYVPTSSSASSSSTSTSTTSSSASSSSTSTSSLPLSQPSRQPSSQLSVLPSEQPSCLPSLQPSSLPSSQPSSQPSRQGLGSSTSASIDMSYLEMSYLPRLRNPSELTTQKSSKSISIDLPHLSRYIQQNMTSKPTTPMIEETFQNKFRNRREFGVLFSTHCKALSNGEKDNLRKKYVKNMSFINGNQHDGDVNRAYTLDGVDMEHLPFRFQTLHAFLSAMCPSFSVTPFLLYSPPKSSAQSKICQCFC